MYYVSVAYLEILAIGRRLFFQEKLPKGMRREEKKKADLVYVGTDTLNVLRNHPQFGELERGFGLSLTPQDEHGTYRVEVSKYYGTR